MKHFKIFDLPSTEMWYFYLYSCKANLEELENSNEEIKLDFVVLNNGSQFAENDHMLVAYIILFVIWLAMLLRYAVPIVGILSLKNPNSVKVVVYGGLLVLGVAYLYRLIHLLIYWGDGGGVHIF